MVLVVVVVVVRRLVLVLVSAVLLQLLLRLLLLRLLLLVVGSCEVVLPVPAGPAGGVPLPGDAARAACSELLLRGHSVAAAAVESGRL